MTDIHTVATADIPADTVLFTIPRASIINKDTSPLIAQLPAVFGPQPAAGATAAAGATQDQEDHDMDEDSPDEVEDEDDGTSQDAWTTLILILIHEHLRGPASPWKPYLDILPQSAAGGPGGFSTPMFWAPDELAELQASPVAGRVGRAEAEAMIRGRILPVVRAHPDVFFPPADGASSGTTPPPPERDDDEALVRLAFRMGSVIMAYAFDLEKDEDDDDDDDKGVAKRRGDGSGGDDDDEEDDEWIEDREGKTTLGMVPMADVLNADAAFNAHIEHGAAALTATTLRPIARGEEVLNYYGPLSCGELLRRYGYVTPTHRRWNLVDLAWAPVLAALRAELASRGAGSAARLDDEAWERVAALLEEDEVELEEDFIVERGASDPDSEGRVDEVARRAGPPEELVEQLKEVMKAVKKARPDAVPDKTVRDRVIYGAIARALEERTRQYGTTLEQDLALYEKSGAAAGADESAGRKRMALDVRIGEKVLLKQASEAVKEKLAVLEVAARDGDGRSAKRRKM